MNKECLSKDYLQRCRDVTKYYKKEYGSWEIKDQILKIYEEVGEIKKARTLDNLLEECCDTILATITIFDILNTPFDEVNNALEKTLKKVENRTLLTIQDSSKQ